MKGLIYVLGVLVIAVVVSHTAVADVYTPSEAYLLDTINWVDTGQADGTLHSRTNIAGPWVRYEISLDTVTFGAYWSDIQIGDGFDLPDDNSGLATGLPKMGSDFTGYDTYELLIHNPNTDLSFMANITPGI